MQLPIGLEVECYITAKLIYRSCSAIITLFTGTRGQLTATALLCACASEGVKVWGWGGFKFNIKFPSACPEEEWGKEGGDELNKGPPPGGVVAPLSNC